jgi:hypothetical protein
MANSSKASAAADEQPPSLFPPTPEVNEKVGSGVPTVPTHACPCNKRWQSRPRSKTKLLVPLSAGYCWLIC